MPLTRKAFLKSLTGLAAEASLGPAGRRALAPGFRERIRKQR